MATASARRPGRHRGAPSWLAVATAAEARALRDHGLGVRILVMGALSRDELRACEEAEADVVAWTDEVAETASRVHVKLDTGMGRLGTKDREQALRLAARPSVAGLMTHFATADERRRSLPPQLEAFEGFVDEVVATTSWPTLRTARPALREPCLSFAMVLWDRHLRMDPFHESGQDQHRPCHNLLLYPACALRVRRLCRLRPALDSDQPTWVAPCQSATGTLAGRAPHQRLYVLSATAAVRLCNGQHGQRYGGARRTPTCAWATRPC